MSTSSHFTFKLSSFILVLSQKQQTRNKALLNPNILSSTCFLFVSANPLITRNRQSASLTYRKRCNAGCQSQEEDCPVLPRHFSSNTDAHGGESPPYSPSWCLTALSCCFKPQTYRPGIRVWLQKIPALLNATTGAPAQPLTADGRDGGTDKNPLWKKSINTWEVYRDVTTLSSPFIRVIHLCIFVSLPDL